MGDLVWPGRHGAGLRGLAGRIGLTGPVVAVLILGLGAAPVHAALPAAPRAELEQAHALVAGLAGASAEPRLDAAAAALDRASGPTLWVDPNHVVAPSYGETMFTDTLAAIDDLSGLSPISLVYARGLVLAADRGVADGAITEAAGGDGGVLSRARSELNGGDAELSAGHYHPALEDYRHAWLDAFGALTGSTTAAVTSIPAAELAADAEAAIASPTLAVFAPSLVEHSELFKLEGRPLLFFVGYEFCPYCGTQSWGLIAALSQFGRWRHLRLVSSDPTDWFSVSGFTFRDASYSSSLLKVETLEEYSSVPDPRSKFFPYAVLQRPTREEARLFDTYDPFGGAPFIDLANIFTTLGASVNPEDLQGFDWSQIVAALRDPTTVPAQAIAATAETITAQICEVTDEHPASICQTPVVKRFEDFLNGASGGGYCPGGSGSAPGSVSAATAARGVLRRPKHPRRVRLIPRGAKPRASAARCSV